MKRRGYIIAAKKKKEEENDDELMVQVLKMLEDVENGSEKPIKVTKLGHDPGNVT